MSEPARATVMLVEDNETIRNAFGILLEESGYRVVQASSGAEALDLARRDHPDLALMDLGLPDIGGLEVTRRLKAEPTTREIAVLALTGRALDADQRACEEAGCSGYLTKPVDSHRLLEVIEGLLPPAAR
jgi:two-component system cell cycle response regulator DivK